MCDSDLNVQCRFETSAGDTEIVEKRIGGLFRAGRIHGRVFTDVESNSIEYNDLGVIVRGIAQVLQDLLGVMVRPVVDDNAKEINGGTFDGLRSKEVVY